MIIIIIKWGFAATGPTRKKTTNGKEIDGGYFESVKEKRTRPIMVDLDVVFIDISGGGVAVCIYARRARARVRSACVRVCTRWLTLSDYEGVRYGVARLVHGTEGDRYELQPLVRALSGRPARIFNPSATLLVFSLRVRCLLLLLLLYLVCHPRFNRSSRDTDSLSWRFPSRFRPASNVPLISATVS